MPQRALLLAWAVGLTVGLPACQKPADPTPAETYPAEGTLEITLGNTEVERDLAGASCRTESRGGRRLLHVTAPTTASRRTRSGRLIRPNHLTATLPDVANASEGVPFEPTADSPLSATASLFDVTIAGQNYPMFQLIARRMPGHDRRVACRWKKGEKTSTLHCNHVLPFPWHAQALADSSFRAEFRCASPAQHPK
jgi:hypothetical protein